VTAGDVLDVAFTIREQQVPPTPVRVVDQRPGRGASCRGC